MTDATVGAVTSVQLGRRTRRGVVQRDEPQFPRGTFPVWFDGGIWRLRAADDVTVLAQPTPGAQDTP